MNAPRPRRLQLVPRPPAGPGRSPTRRRLVRRRDLLRTIAVAALALLLAVVIADELTAMREDRVVEVGAAPRIAIADGVGGGLRGGIEVAAGEPGRIRIRGKVHGTWRVAYRLEQRGDEIAISVRPRSLLGWLSAIGPARFAIAAPADTRVEVESRSAPIAIEGIAGGGTLSATDGAIRIARARGDWTAVGTHGSILVDDLEGRAHLRTGNGWIAVRGGRGVFDLETTSGSIELDAELAPDGRHRAETSGGSVHVRLRGDPSLTVDARTSGGVLAVSREIAASERSAHALRGTIGAGTGALSLRTTGGAIAIE